MTTWITDKLWWSVEDASRLLRVNRKTLLSALASGDFPGTKVGGWWHIPSEALGFKVNRQPVLPARSPKQDYEQLELDLPACMLIPGKRRYRNGEIKVNNYGTEYGRKKTRPSRSV